MWHQLVESIKKVRSMAYCLDDLKYLMSRLREPITGCPWDIAQTYKSIAPSTIEEAYEVVDAIETEDKLQLKEELGDLLFQVVFYSQLGTEDESFDFDDIVDSLTTKLIRRHPHVFPDNDLHGRINFTRTAQDQQKIKAHWEEIKQQERQRKGKGGILDDVPLGLPALSRSVKLQKRASSVGFDWQEISSVLLKVKEEITELEDAIAADDIEHINEEFGDVLFSMTNLSRHLNINPEVSLRDASRKFESRFRFIETSLASDNLAFEQVSSAELEQLWLKAKSAEKAENQQI